MSLYLSYGLIIRRHQWTKHTCQTLRWSPFWRMKWAQHFVQQMSIMIIMIHYDSGPTQSPSVNLNYTNDTFFLHNAYGNDMHLFNSYPLLVIKSGPLHTVCSGFERPISIHVLISIIVNFQLFFFLVWSWIVYNTFSGFKYMNSINMLLDISFEAFAALCFVNDENFGQ